MVTHILDTTVCVQLLQPQRGALVERCVSHKAGSLAISSVTLGELAFGACLSAKETEAARVATLAGDLQIIPFDEAAALEYGRLRYELKTAGTPICGLDMMIAAAARANDWTLVTHNTAEFGKIQELRLEDWQG